MNRFPDVEVIFEFNGTRKNPANDGYRPAHLVMDDYLDVNPMTKTRRPKNRTEKLVVYLE